MFAYASRLQILVIDKQLVTKYVSRKKCRRFLFYLKARYFSFTKVSLYTHHRTVVIHFATNNRIEKRLSLFTFFLLKRTTRRYLAGYIFMKFNRKS